MLLLVLLICIPLFAENNQDSVTFQDIYEKLIEEGVFDPGAQYTFRNCSDSLVAAAVRDGEIKQLLQKGNLKAITKNNKLLTNCACCMVSYHCSKSSDYSKSKCKSAVAILYVLSHWEESCNKINSNL